MEAMEEAGDTAKAPEEAGDQSPSGLRMEPEPQGPLPDGTQSYFMPDTEQRLLYEAALYWVCRLLLLENGAPNEVILTNRRDTRTVRPVV